MKTKNFILIFFLTLNSLHSFGQIDQDQKLDVPIYKLFPTENYWTFLKLDTRNGKIWQVHYSVSDGFEGELDLNPNSLIPDEKEISGRFNLYQTENMYNFLLLDQLAGTSYQVQWNNEKHLRFVSQLYYGPNEIKVTEFYYNGLKCEIIDRISDTEVQIKYPTDSGRGFYKKVVKMGELEQVEKTIQM